MEREEREKGGESAEAGCGFREVRESAARRNRVSAA
jgi:hypothetical protein